MPAGNDSPRTIVITGATDGIGRAATERLVRAGHNVIAVGRSPKKAAAARQALGNVWLTCDFSDLSQVCALIDALLEHTKTIDVLANNAGGINGERIETGDGFERTFQVNHLAPFLLTAGLIDRLPTLPQTVIMTSSVAARMFARPDLADTQWRRRRYQAMLAYGETKLFNAVIAREISRRYCHDGLSGVSFHPGVVGSNFASAGGGIVGLIYRNAGMKRVMRSPADGATQLCQFALGTPGVDYLPGEYYANSRATRTHPLVYDPQFGAALWEQSMALIKPWRAKLGVSHM